MTESEVQKEIKATLKILGFEVKDTSSPIQKRKGAISKGIADLLVIHPDNPGIYIGLEVKAPGKVKFTSDEQKDAWEKRHFFICQSPLDAVMAVASCLSTSSHYWDRCMEFIGKSGNAGDTL